MIQNKANKQLEKSQKHRKKAFLEKTKKQKAKIS